jgi:hypothetical protein
VYITFLFFSLLHKLLYGTIQKKIQASEEDDDIKHMNQNLYKIYSKRHIALPPLYTNWLLPAVRFILCRRSMSRFFLPAVSHDEHDQYRDDQSVNYHRFNKYQTQHK